MSAKFLAHYDPSLKLTLACDASNYGLGAVLAHKMPDRSERPIGYASRTLSKAERNYSQWKKEGLASIFGINKFHDYLFGSSYEYNLVFRNTTAHANTNALSRLPLPVVPAKTSTPLEIVLLLEHLEGLPVTANDIRVWTN